jgi:TM2 domain-containing membrane protein YozV
VGTPEPRSIRIGTAEREQAVKALGDHFAQGRLEPHEFEERMTAAYGARTAAELDRLFDDLPRAGLPPHPGGRPAAPRTALLPGPHLTDHPAATHPDDTPYRYPAPVGYDPQAPYGREPLTGQPYSDRFKLVAGLLQMFVPCGIGRLYSGHTGIGVAQLLLAPFLIGMIWAFIDGIVILAGRPTDPRGRPLRP